MKSGRPWPSSGACSSEHRLESRCYGRRRPSYPICPSRHTGQEQCPCHHQQALYLISANVLRILRAIQSMRVVAYWTMHSETTAMTLAFVFVLGDCKENDNWRLHAKFSQCHAWGSWQDPEQTSVPKWNRLTHQRQSLMYYPQHLGISIFKTVENSSPVNMLELSSRWNITES